MADLLPAIQRLANKLIPNSTGDQHHAYVLRLAEYSARYAGQSAPVQVRTALAAEPSEEPLSRIPGVALAQILAACGFDSTQTTDPLAVLDKASPDQNRQLALLGFFGQPSKPVSGADYSLFTKYYKELPVGLTEGGQPTEGNWIPINETVAQDGAWQTYLSDDR